MTDEDSIKVKSASERSLNKNVAFNNNLKTAISEIEKCIDERPTWGFYRFPVEDINKFNNDSPNWDFFNAIIAIYNEAGFKAYVEPQYVYENSEKQGLLSRFKAYVKRLLRLYSATHYYLVIEHKN